jgi:2-aminoadipate transaminase
MLDTALLTLEDVSLADWLQSVKQSALRDMLAIATRPGILSFALGLPATDLFPRKAYAQAAADVLANDLFALQYGLPFRPLKSHIVGLMEQRGVRCSEEQIFLTTGAQHAMSLLAHLLLNPFGQVMIEETIYDGMPKVIEPFQPELLEIRTDATSGLDVEQVESLLIRGARPAFIYVITDGHNPLGINLSREKRQHLVELAQRYQVPIIEDDAYGLLCYEREEPPIRALDERWVFYVSSFSKILAPSLRVGWVVLPEFLTSKMSIVKQGSDMDISTLAQRTVSAFMDAGHMLGHLALLRRSYSQRRDVMIRALRENLPPEVHCGTPASGLFIWVELPRHLDALELLKVAVDTERVAFIPGHAFSTTGGSHANHCMRLNFSNSTVEQLEDGVARLARVINKALG